ncbi:hypothetical protein N0V93_002986 [Gnomoniopsis smithogilvyi]|uniref:Heterokaryon incompatibility domain-containing protein n=1 Tax=Gnomoniopsis smithogilvyi TaxID=1191159 RepID=A0A9W8YXL5_9PEZI|nr:hypothetical protein N0V93_002986 [Gnomoniopsis smithogilvyi]
MAPHLYRGLDHKRFEIRVLTLLPASTCTDPIKCSLSHVSLDDDIQFEALSYVWGPPNPRYDIVVDGASFTVTTNLHEALKALRRGKKPRVLWVDAICINQDDDDEKAYQVPLMGRLYTEAPRTIIWFGASNENVDALITWLNIHGPERKLLSGLKHGAKNLVLSEKAERTRDLMMLKAAHGFFDILTTRYWYRMWTFQEFLLPKDDPLCYCGTHEFHMEALGDTRSRILDAVSEVRHRMNTKVAAAGGIVDNDGPLTEWMEAVAKLTTSLSKKSVEAQSLGSVFALRKAFRTETRSLAYYLGMTSERECSRVHDRFYALYGIMPELKDTIPVDYKVSVREVTLAICSYVINTEEIMNIYSCFGLLPSHLDSQSDYPSWVPNFARGSDETDGSERYYTEERLPRSLYMSALEQTPRANVEDLVMLHAYGLKVGVVVKTTILPTRLKDIFTALQALFSRQDFDFAAPRLQKLSGAEQTERLAAAISSNISFLHSAYGRDRASNLIQTVQDVCKQYAAGDTPHYPKSWTRLRVPTDFGYLAGRAVFVTDTGLIGLGVTHIVEGDVVTVLSRESLPIVLREKSGKPENHKLVGTAYIDGLMDNEWLDKYFLAQISGQPPTRFCIQ